MLMRVFVAGIRVINVNGDTGDVASGLRDGACVYVRDAEAAADDHLRLGQAVDPDVPELARSAHHQRAADGGHRLRGDRAHV